MKNELEFQIGLLKQYGVNNYIVKDGKIIIKSSLILYSFTNYHKDFLKNTIIDGILSIRTTKCVHKDFLKNTVINGSLIFVSLINCHKDFLKYTTFNGNLVLSSLINCHKDFLKNSIINGNLDLPSLTIYHKDFLKNTFIGGNLYFDSLNKEDNGVLKNNIPKLVKGYNKDKSYCYFDGILSKVNFVSYRNEYTVYETPFDIIVQKGEYTAHGNNFKKAKLDLEFKIIAKKIKKEPINRDTLFTVKYYRTLTGACDKGCRDFMIKHELPFKNIDNETIEIQPMKAEDLLVYLEKDKNTYGLNKFKELLTF